MVLSGVSCAHSNSVTSARILAGGRPLGQTGAALLPVALHGSPSPGWSGAAPSAPASAGRGDAVAQKIVGNAHRELAHLVKHLARQLRFKHVPVACAGSLFQDTGFQKGFWRALRPLRITKSRQKTDAATALAKSIM